MKVKIFLRSIVHRDPNNGFRETKRLALFDSNRRGDINELETGVNRLDTIIWVLDCCSGIKSITSIYSSGNGPVFKSQPKKRFLCKGFILKLNLPEEEKVRREKYTIECILCDNETLIVDPYIRVPPPPGK